MEKRLERALHLFVELIGKGDYFDAHEVLEEAWHPMRKSGVESHLLVKGLINGAIAFEHIKRACKESHSRARKVIKSYERHKKKCMQGILHYELFLLACQEVESLKMLHSEVFDVLVS